MTRKIIATIIICLFTLSGSAVATATSHTTVVTTLTSHRVPKSERWFLPIFQEGPTAVEGFTCVIARESTSTIAHPNLGDDNGDGVSQSGIFQMSNQPTGIWDKYVLPHLHVVIWKATAYQQAWGAALMWRIERFLPWTQWDGCS
jgi:hypothetical protein